jgi:hypothetical protein
MEPLRIVNEPENTDAKYITFKRQDFLEWLGFLHSQDPSTYALPVLVKDVNDLAIADAVVIRRQDLFASPALATYAATIGMVSVALKQSGARHTEDLLKVADYFQRQSELAADEGWKYPDL